MDLTSGINDEIVFQTEENLVLPSFVAPFQEESVDGVSDVELTKLVASGNITAFEEIYQRHHRRTYSICLRMTQNPSEAEDLTQEVYIQIYRKAGSFRGESAFSTWLHRLTVNQVLMHFRRRSFKNERTTEDGEMPEPIIIQAESSQKSPLLDRIDIDNAVEQLPAGYKTIFILHDIEGFDHEEISRKIGVSVGTSKSQLHKARLKMRKLLKKENIINSVRQATKS
jgi:RNA polymerase sigma-70 factor, ECF subfamily